MLSKNVILCAGLHADIRTVIQNAILDTFKFMADITFENTEYIQCYQQAFRVNMYHIVIMQYKDVNELITNLSFIRKLDDRIQIIIISAQDTDYFMVQKYHINFVLRLQNLSQDLYALMDMLSYNRQFYMPSHERFLMVYSIYYMESDRNYIHIHSMEGMFRERFTMKELCVNETLRGFILVNKSIFLNPFRIQQVDHNMIRMESGQVIYISRGRLRDVHDRLRGAISSTIFF